MAKVTNPLMSQDARGSVAGVQYSRNRSGNFGSRKSTSNRKQSPDVVQHRARIKRAHTRWTSITQALRDAWEAYAPITIGGRAAFVGAQIRNYTMDPVDLTLSPIDAPPRSTPNDLVAKMTSLGPDRLTLTWDLQANDQDAILLYAAYPRGPYMPHVRKFKFLDYAEPFDETITHLVAYVPPFTAVRIIHWDYFRGVTLSEWRAVLIGEQAVQITPDWP